jgi:hypothetical protein
MITLETALLTALSGVVSALVFVCKLLWKRSEQCESDRRELREEMERVKESNGMANGRLEAFRMCPQAECPFQRNAQSAPLARPPQPVSPRSSHG